MGSRRVRPSPVCQGEGSPRAWSALVGLARLKQQQALYNQPSPPSCSQRGGTATLIHFPPSSLEVYSDTAYKIEWWCVLRPQW